MEQPPSERLKSRDIYTNPEEQVLAGKLREALTALDEQAMRGIFQRELTRSGVAAAADVVNDLFIPFSEVTIDAHYTGATQGRHSVRDGITLNVKPIIEDANMPKNVAQGENLDAQQLLHDHWSNNTEH